MKTGCHCLKLAGAAMVLYLLIAAAPAFSFSGATKAPTAAPPVTPAEYAGSDACKACHEDLYTKRFELTAHYKTTCRADMAANPVTGPVANMSQAEATSARSYASKNSHVSRRARAA
jgi:hypothetical protein